MGCCQTKERELRTSFRKVKPEATNIIVQDVTEKSDNSKVYKEVTNDPQTVFVKRDVKKCFKTNLNDNFSPRQRGGVLKISINLQKGQTKNSSSDLKSPIQ